MTDWAALVPDYLARGGVGVKFFEPDTDTRRLAGVVCERAWRGDGVRVYRWSCGSLALVNVGSRADGRMLDACIDMLLVTYGRHAVNGQPRRGAGPMLVDVLHDLHWARGASA